MHDYRISPLAGFLYRLDRLHRKNIPAVVQQILYFMPSGSNDRIRHEPSMIVPDDREFILFHDASRIIVFTGDK